MSLNFDLGGQYSSNKTIMVLSLLMLVSLSLALLGFLHVERSDFRTKRYLEQTEEQQVAAERILALLSPLSRAEAPAFDSLKKTRDRMDLSVSVLRSGNPGEGLEPVPGFAMDAVNQLSERWNALKSTLGLLLENQRNLEEGHQYQRKIQEHLPQLIELSEQLTQALLKEGFNAVAIHQVGHQSFLLRQMGDGLNQLFDHRRPQTASIESVNSDLREFTNTFNALTRGGDRQGMPQVQDTQNIQTLKEIALLAKSVQTHWSELSRKYPAVDTVLNAVESIPEKARAIGESSRQMSDLFRGRQAGGDFLGVEIGPFTVFMSALATLVFLILLGAQLLLDARRREAVSKEQNEANQKAILRLLDEMGDLADGDLTVTATVTEDITGAIADSINYAIEALRNLVTTINSTAEQVSRSAQHSRTTAEHLADASEKQAGQITQATQSIRSMTRAIDKMSEDAGKSLEVAARSVDIANTGGEVVRNTIASMDSIRDQIQETSKRIKRLGESSQEIGDIVELIDDIADQTNILALNAAMQAAMAGEAGRGFAVVADEVQRLAERSSNATKQIEALVRTIQADTNEAVKSMETSTGGVVKVAKQAEDAGEALSEIENVSNYLADMIRQIADSTITQSEQTSRIDDLMNLIQDITNQTTSGTKQTAASIGQLAELADELRRSVAGFRLP